MILDIKVKTNSGKKELVKLNDHSYIVYLKSPPEDNKANMELIKMLNREFKTPLRIISGKKSKDKKVKIEDVNKI